MGNSKKTPYSISFVLATVLLATSSVVVIDAFQKSIKNTDKYKETKRIISSNEAKSCLGQFSNLFPSAKKRWSKLLEDYDFGDSFDYKTYNAFRELYLEQGADLGLVEKTPESLLAYLESYNLRANLPSKLNIETINPLQRRKLVRLIDSIDPRDENSMREFTFEVYQTLLGPKYKIADALGADERLKDVAYRIIQEDLSAYGLKIMSSKYQFFSGDNGLIEKIVTRPHIQKLLKKVVYLPTIMGYMPPTKSFKVPDKFLGKLLNEGMSERLFMDIMDDLNQQGLLDYQSTIRYEVFRRYYNIGITLVWSYISLEALVERDEELKAQREVLTSATTEIAQKINQANQVRKDALAELSTVETFESSSRECRRFNRCLKYASKELGRKLSVNDNEYKQCKERRDPENQCE